eukprot:708315_1
MNNHRLSAVNDNPAHDIKAQMQQILNSPSMVCFDASWDTDDLTEREYDSWDNMNSHDSPSDVVSNKMMQPTTLTQHETIEAESMAMNREPKTDHQQNQNISTSMRQEDNTLVKAVFGFYHIHCHKYITSDVIKLSIEYLWASDAFISDDTENVLITGGIDSNICRCISNGIHTVYGRNTISYSKERNDNYHHWRFKVFPQNTQLGDDSEDGFSIRIGLDSSTTLLKMDE